MRSGKEQSLGRRKSITLIFISRGRAHVKYLGPEGARLFKKAWVNEADMAIRAAVKLSGQSNNMKRNFKESLWEMGESRIGPYFTCMDVFHLDSSLRSPGFVGWYRSCRGGCSTEQNGFYSFILGPTTMRKQTCKISILHDSMKCVAQLISSLASHRPYCSYAATLLV